MPQGVPTSLNDACIASLPAARPLTMDHLLDIVAIEKKEQLFGEDCPAVAYREDLRKKVSVVADDVFHKTLSKAAKVASGTPAKHTDWMATPSSKSIWSTQLGHDDVWLFFQRIYCIMHVPHVFSRNF